MGMIIQNGKVFSGEPKTTYTERVLWSGSQTVTTSGVDITLSNNLSEYDEVIFEYHNSSFNGISNFIVSGLTIGDSYIQEAYRPNSLGVWFTYTNDTSLNIKAISSNITYTKITGIKYGDTVKRKDYHVYSTEEQIVGEWVDGSTIYERNFYYTQASMPGSSSPITITSDLSADIKDVIKIDIAGRLHYNSEDQDVWCTDEIVGRVNLKNHTLQVWQTWTSAVTAYSNFAVSVVLRYTKSSI